MQRLDPARVVRSERIRNHLSLEEIESDWRELWLRTEHATVFQSPDWLIPWWTHHGRAEDLRVASIRSGRDLVGLLPFFLFVDPIAERRQLTLLGNGLSDQLGILLHPDFEDAVLLALREMVSAEAGLSSCDFRDLPARSPLIRVVPPPSFDRDLTTEAPSPVLPLPDRPDKLAEVIPSRFLRKLDYALKRASREGEVRFRTATYESVESDLRILWRLHHARWNHESSAAPRDDRQERFHEEAAARLAAAGLLRLHVLSVGGRDAAVFYGFHAHGRTSYYLGGFDPVLKILSPGSLVIRHAIERAIEDDALEFDFLRGSEPYKYAWGAVDRPQFRVRWLRRDGAS